MRVIPPWSARRGLAPGQHGGNGREEVAPVKARRDALRLPLDVPAARAYGTPLNQLEQAVARADVPAAVSLENNGWPRPADAGIDDAQKDGFRCKPFGVSPADRPMPWDCQPAHQQRGQSRPCPA